MRLIFTVLFLLSFAALWAQGIENLPVNGKVGHWQFENAQNLGEATTGNDLIPEKIDGGDAEITAVSGPAVGNGAIRVALGSYLRVEHDIEPNGADPALQDSVPSRVNQYSIVIDFKKTVNGVWYGFTATDNDGDPVKNDWDSFLRSNGRLGVGSTGYSHHKFDDTENWYRLVIVSDLGTTYKYFIDANLAQDGSPRSLDDRLSLDSPDNSNALLLFGDNDGEDALIDVAEVVLYDRALTEEEVKTLGGYGHFVEYGPAVGAWNFDDSVNPLSASNGNDLMLVGSHNVVSGPTATDGAVSIAAGNHYVAQHDIAINGTESDGKPTKTNRYTVSMDVKIPATNNYYALMQTDPTNTTGAALFIRNDGQIGSEEIGWTTGFEFKAGEWYRISMAVNLGDTLTNVVVVVDGDSVLAKKSLAKDGKLALSAKNDDNKILFFADDNGEDNTIEVAKVTIHNRALSVSELKNLGGYEHLFSTEVTAALKAVEFKLADNVQYATVPYSEDFDIPAGRDFTVETWVKIGAGISSDPSFLSNKDWDSGSNPGWNFAAKDDAWDFNIADSGRNRIDFDPPNINDGQWHHVAFVVDHAADEIRCITDDLVQVIKIHSDEPAFSNVINSDKLVLAFGQDGTEGYSAKFPGSLDEVRIWHAAVSFKDLKSWSYKKVDNSHPNFAALKGYWDFDNVQNNIVPDLSGNGHDATLKNNPSELISYAPLGAGSMQAQHEVASTWAGKNKGWSNQGGTPYAVSGGLAVMADYSAQSEMPALLRATKPNFIFAKTSSFIDEMYATIGHNKASGVSTADLAGNVEARLKRIWYYNASETFNKTVELTFTITNVGAAENYVLLKRSGTSGAFNGGGVTATVTDTTISFANVTMDKDNYYTLATLNQTASPLGDITSINTELNGPLTFALNRNYPNPFNPSTTISYSIAKASDVSLTVYNALGQKVDVLVNKVKMPAGSYQVNWNAAGMASGIYFYRLEAGTFVKTYRMLLIK